MEKYVIYVENSVMGTKLSLEKNKNFEATVEKEEKKNNGYTRWAVEEDFNGLSLPTRIYRNENGDIVSDFIYGFYKPGMKVTLYVYGGNGKVLKDIKEVKILDKKGVNHGV